VLGSTSSREVASMFLALDQVAEDLVTNFSWKVLRAPVDRELVLPDMGLTMYDPTPPHPDSGLGFRSSPNTETVLPVDPTFAIALTPGAPEWHDEEVDEAAIEEINLRAYAWSNAAFYGRSQKVVTDLRVNARRQTERLAQFAPRSGRMWVTEVEGGPTTGELEFTGHSPEGQRRARFVIDPRAFDDVTPFRG
jgi:hypothetical protein